MAERRTFPVDDLLAAFQAGDYLTAIARQLHDAGLTVQVEVIAEAPASGMSAEAQEHQADLIVMATHGREGFDAFLHPSITWGVLRQRRAPILTWKVTERAGHPHDSSWIPRFLQDVTVPFLVPLDGSLLAEQALPLAQELKESVQNHQVGLVVMASHGRSGVGRLLLGSVAMGLLSCLEVPIGLVRHHPEAEAAIEVAEDDREN